MEVEVTAPPGTIDYVDVIRDDFAVAVVEIGIGAHSLKRADCVVASAADGTGTIILVPSEHSPSPDPIVGDPAVGATQLRAELTITGVPGDQVTVEVSRYTVIAVFYNQDRRASLWTDTPTDTQAGAQRPALEVAQ